MKTTMHDIKNFAYSGKIYEKTMELYPTQTDKDFPVWYVPDADLLVAADSIRVENIECFRDRKDAIRAARRVHAAKIKDLETQLEKLKAVEIK